MMNRDFALQVPLFSEAFVGPRSRSVAEYALRDINKSVSIYECQVAESLPEKLNGSLPTIEELESEPGAAPADGS